MTIDLESFRTALRDGADDGRPPAIDDIIHAGRRLRRRRRITIGSAAAAAIVVATGATAVLWQPQAPPDGAATPPGIGGVASYEWNGDVIDAADTGIRDGAARVVVAAHRDDDEFGLRACVTVDDRRISTCADTPDTTPRPGRAPGFHAIASPGLLDDVPVPVHGYYVGPAARITAVVGGRTVDAETAVWSEDPNVVLFWFPLDRIGLESPAEPTGWAATDAQERDLPRGTPRYH